MRFNIKLYIQIPPHKSSIRISWPLQKLRKISPTNYLLNLVAQYQLIHWICNFVILHAGNFILIISDGAVF